MVGWPIVSVICKVFFNFFATENQLNIWKHNKQNISKLKNTTKISQKFFCEKNKSNTLFTPIVVLCYQANRTEFSFFLLFCSVKIFWKKTHFLNDSLVVKAPQLRRTKFWFGFFHTKILKDFCHVFHIFSVLYFQLLAWFSVYNVTWQRVCLSYFTTGVCYVKME